MRIAHNAQRRFYYVQNMLYVYFNKYVIQTTDYVEQTACMQLRLLLAVWFHIKCGCSKWYVSDALLANESRNLHFALHTSIVPHSQYVHEQNLVQCYSACRIHGWMCCSVLSGKYCASDCVCIACIFMPRLISSARVVGVVGAVMRQIHLSHQLRCVRTCTCTLASAFVA